jgi:Rieske 2Fe-2S family protein
VGDYDTLTMDGQMTDHGRGFLDGITEDDHKKIYYFVVWPNLLISLHPDYLMTHRVVPITPGRTYVACEFFFDPEQMASPGFDPSDATEFWDLTNRQDWEVCELQQQGTASRAYTAGRFTGMESGVYAFDVKVADRYANDGVLTHIEEISKADASAKLAGRIKSRAVAD